MRVTPNDFRDVLAIARTGSLGGASSALGIDASTMGRRLAALEARVGRPLFTRSPVGLVTTVDGARMLATGERMEDEMLDFERGFLGASQSLRGELRVTAAEWGVSLLTPIIATFGVAHPELVITLSIENRVLDLARREADVAVRLDRPRTESLTGRRIGALRYGVYASAEYLSSHRAPTSPKELVAHPLCTLDDGFDRTPHMRWLHRHARGARVSFRTNSVLALVEAVRAGLGVGVLPEALVNPRSGLTRLFSTTSSVSRELWLVYHSDLKRAAPVRALGSYVAEKLAGVPAIAAASSRGRGG